MSKLKVSWDPKLSEQDRLYKEEMDKPDKIYTNQKVEGYWYSKYEPDYPIPIPNILSQTEADEIYSLMVEKQKEAKVNKYMGYSMSRLTDKMLGCIEYELEDWRWTGNLDKHYVKDHRVKPSDEFLTFIGYPNKNETKATTEIKYNNWKRVMKGMADEISKEVDKEILNSILKIK